MHFLRMGKLSIDKKKVLDLSARPTKNTQSPTAKNHGSLFSDAWFIGIGLINLEI
jgi:hypothetical protein